MNDTKDEHSGKGGSYVMENGKRVLQARTGHTPQPAQPAAAPQAEKKITKTTKQNGVNNA